MEEVVGKFYVSMVETTENGYSLVADDNSRQIMAFRTAQEGLNYYENGYKTCHSRCYEWSMSATLNSIQYRYSIVEFESLESLVSQLFDSNDNFQVLRMSSVSGYVYAFKIDKQEHAKVLWENGQRPKLI